jgi:hypothetical protein
MYRMRPCADAWLCRISFAEKRRLFLFPCLLKCGYQATCGLETMSISSGNSRYMSKSPFRGSALEPTERLHESLRKVTGDKFTSSSRGSEKLQLLHNRRHIGSLVRRTLPTVERELPERIRHRHAVAVLGLGPRRLTPALKKQHHGDVGVHVLQRLPLSGDLASAAQKKSSLA